MLKKILLLSHDSDLQGAERCLLDLVTHLDRDRFEPLVVLPWQGTLADELERAGIPYLIRYVIRHWIPYRKKTDWRYPFRYLQNWKARLWALMGLAERENVDLIYTNTTTVLDGALAARRLGIPHVWHIHEYLDGNQDLRTYLPHTWIDRVIVTLSDRILTPSKSLAAARFPKSSDKVRVVPNGIELSRFQTGDGDRIRSELGIPRDAPVVTLIGAVSMTKDPLTFAAAAGRIVQARPDTHFLLAGSDADPVLGRQLRAFIHRNGLESRFHLLGFRRDTADILAASTIHVSTSIQEVQPINLLEAMAAGKPVVATRCGGPEEVVADGETGFVVPPRDPEAVARAAGRLIDDPELARRMGRAGKRRAEREFTVQAYARRIGDIIEETVACRASVS